jgi:hypothetical protein
MKVKTVHFTPPVQQDRSSEQIAIAVFYIAVPSLLFYTMVHQELQYAFTSASRFLQEFYVSDMTIPIAHASEIDVISSSDYILEGN